MRKKLGFRGSDFWIMLLLDNSSGRHLPIPEFVLMLLHQTAVSGVWKGANENYSHLKLVSFIISCCLNHHWLSYFFCYSFHCLFTSEMVLIMPKVAFQITQMIILVFCQAYREKCVDSLKVSLFKLQVSKHRKILVRMQREKN